MKRLGLNSPKHGNTPCCTHVTGDEPVDVNLKRSVLHSAPLLGALNIWVLAKYFHEKIRTQQPKTRKYSLLHSCNRGRTCGRQIKTERSTLGPAFRGAEYLGSC